MAATPPEEVRLHGYARICQTTDPVGSLGVVIATAGALPTVAAPPADKVFLAPHRAVYDLKLIKSKGSRGIDAVRGRILYDFSGNACDGYDLKFRQVSELDSGEGKRVLSDLRSTTWEDGKANKFRFNSENLLNERQTDAVDGHADRGGKTVSVSLNKPKEKNFTVPVGAVFPTEHMRRIIVAARADKTILEFPVYDGSETGEKLYNTLTVIGKAIAPGEKPPQDAAAKIPALAKLTRWPVTISYFEKQNGSRNRKASRRRSMPFHSSFTRTASRARSRSIIPISASRAK